MDKEKKKFLQRRLGWIAVRTFIFLSESLPLRLSYFIGRILGNIAYLAVLRHRRIAIDSLSIAFPRLSLKRKKEIARDFFVSITQGSFELLYFLKHPRQLQNVRIEGKKYLEKALEKKKGVIIFTAHLGNFPLMSLKLAKSGFPVNIVVRPMRDEQAGKYFHSLRIRAGVKTILSYPRRECVSGIMRALRSNEVVIIQMDQNFGTGGVWVKFFNRLAATPVGPIILGLRTKAAMVPAYTYREDKGIGKHCIRIFPQEELIIKENKDETVLLNAVKFTRMIEGWIREFAHQWGWIHRRWKSRPSDKIRNTKFKVESP